jgi:hypothetical protein
MCPECVLRPIVFFFVAFPIREPGGEYHPRFARRVGKPIPTVRLSGSTHPPAAVWSSYDRAPGGGIFPIFFSFHQKYQMDL